MLRQQRRTRERVRVRKRSSDASKSSLERHCKLCLIGDALKNPFEESNTVHGAREEGRVQEGINWASLFRISRPFGPIRSFKPICWLQLVLDANLLQPIYLCLCNTQFLDYFYIYFSYKIVNQYLLVILQLCIIFAIPMTHYSLKLFWHSFDAVIQYALTLSLAQQQAFLTLFSAVCQVNRQCGNLEIIFVSINPPLHQLEIQ